MLHESLFEIGDERKRIPLDYWIIESRDNLFREEWGGRWEAFDVTIEAEKIARLSARLGFVDRHFPTIAFCNRTKISSVAVYSPPWLIPLRTSGNDSWRRNIQQRLWQISIGYYYAVLKRLKLAALTRPRDRGRCVSGKWMVGGEEKWREGYFEVKIDGRRENKRERGASWKWKWKDFGVIEGIKGWKDG